MKNKSFFQALLAGGVLAGCLAVFYFSFLSGESYIWDDSLYVCYPGANYLATSLASGHIPLWVSGMRDGLPFYSDLAMSAMYPPLWFLALFVKEGVLPFVVYQWYLVGQLLMGGVFTLAFLRLMGLRYAGALAGAVMFMFSAHMSLHLVHPNLVQAYIWLPLELYFVLRIFSKPNPVVSGVGLVLSLLMSFLAGFPQATLYNSYFVVFYWGYLFWMRSKGCPESSIWTLIRGAGLELGKICAVFLVVLGLGAVNFLPAAQNWYHSSRQTFGFKEIADLSLPWFYLIHGLVPNFFGASNGNGSGVPFWGFNKDTLDYQNWHTGAWMYWEFGFYAGQLALVAVAVFVFNWRKFWSQQQRSFFFLCAIVPVLWLMLGRYGYLFNLFYQIVPGFSMFRTPARIGGMLVLCLAVVVGVFVDRILDAKQTLDIRRPMILVGVLYAVFLLAIVSYGESLFPELKSELLRTYAVNQTLLSVLLCGAMCVTAVILTRTQEGSRKFAGGIVLVALCFFDLYLASHNFHQGKNNPGQYYADRNHLISQMQQMRERSGPFRFAQLRGGKVSEEIIFARNNGYLHAGYEAIEGYLLFGLREIGDFASAASDAARLDIQNVGLVANADPQSGRLGVTLYTNGLPRVKFYGQAKVYDGTAAIYKDLGAGRLDYRHKVGVLRTDVEKYGIKMDETVSPVEGEVRFIAQTPDAYQISYRTTGPGIIFISETYYPGWQADGGRFPLIQAFGAFKGIVIPAAGSGVISVVFSPPVLWWGLAISAFTFLLVVIGLWRMGVRQR